MGNIFSNKSFMNRYFSAPKSTGPAKLTDLSGDGKVTQKDVLIGKGVLPKPEAPAKYSRLDKTKEKAKDAKEDADKKVKKLNKTQAEANSMKRSKAKADRLAKRQKRQEGRAERKKIRNIGYTDRFNTRDEIKASRKKQKSEGPAKKEPKRVKIESEGMDGQGSTEYIRGGREGDKNARSVTIEKDYAGKDQKVVRRKKKDGSVKTKSKKISSKRAERIKKRKDKSHSAVS